MAQATREIKRRIKSVKSTSKITKAMELISAVKMRKAVDHMLLSRGYAHLAWQIVVDLAKRTGQTYHKLLQAREVKKVAVVLVASNRGLCGSFNAQIVASAYQYALGLFSGDKAPAVDFFLLGKKARDITLKYKQLAAISSLKQIPRIKQLLPIPQEEDALLGDVGELTRNTLGVKADLREYLFEPSPAEVLQKTLPRLIETQIYQAVLESDASEHSARMLAMKNATEAAHDLIDDLTLAYNQARQAGITQEIAEISGTKAAMS
ncbi:MAG: ATP synthase gamma chain [Candidatus Kuenenbacteria bacterium GW2011_GWA2_42_15]|uniref:ATP synthase gamma chain n=1 Tax=Candidatus Kuenenbacteria bacterium GW2011_GWA2_42_15 TaxID=1618677 RepID=A0A0G1BUS5_9BACT|nr:MAG: ATP synthase gamma chain [Candidatus Kuenenbacteria bacterium GW2011_GWA2_42_15]